MTEPYPITEIHTGAITVRTNAVIRIDEPILVIISSTEELIITYDLDVNDPLFIIDYMMLLDMRGPPQEGMAQYGY